MKKFLISFFIFIVLAGSAGFYYALKYRDTLRNKRQQTKASEISITLVEGWSNEEMGTYLQKNGVTTASQFQKATVDFKIDTYPVLLDKPKYSSLEGYIFPDTYFIPKNPTPDTDINSLIITKALNNFSKKITREMLEQAKTDNLSLFKILTLASIIEKETGRSVSTPAQKQALDDERKIIAGIFYNRLKINMPLQSDATVNFVTKKNAPAPEIKDTEVDSPYNTYKYPGLTPGPICNPSLSSILAALYPTATDYIYFLHDQKTGQAYYAKTYEEHLANKQKYLK